MGQSHCPKERHPNSCQRPWFPPPPPPPCSAAWTKVCIIALLLPSLSVAVSTESTREQPPVLPPGTYLGAHPSQTADSRELTDTRSILKNPKCVLRANGTVLANSPGGSLWRVNKAPHCAAASAPDPRRALLLFPQGDVWSRGRTLGTQGPALASKSLYLAHPVFVRMTQELRTCKTPRFPRKTWTSGLLSEIRSGKAGPSTATRAETDDSGPSQAPNPFCLPTSLRDRINHHVRINTQVNAS